MPHSQKKIISLLIVDTLATIVAALCLWGILGAGVEVIDPIFTDTAFTYPALGISVIICLACAFTLIPLMKAHTASLQKGSGRSL